MKHTKATSAFPAINYYRSSPTKPRQQGASSQPCFTAQRTNGAADRGRRPHPGRAGSRQLGLPRARSGAPRPSARGEPRGCPPQRPQPGNGPPPKGSVPRQRLRPPRARGRRQPPLTPPRPLRSPGPAASAPTPPLPARGTRPAPPTERGDRARNGSVGALVAPGEPARRRTRLRAASGGWSPIPFFSPVRAPRAARREFAGRREEGVLGGGRGEPARTLGGRYPRQPLPPPSPPVERGEPGRSRRGGVGRVVPVGAGAPPARRLEGRSLLAHGRAWCRGLEKTGPRR